MPGDRTEQATAHHRQQAAEKGDRARSRDLMAAAAMLGGVFAPGKRGGRNGWARGLRPIGAAGAGGARLLGAIHDGRDGCGYAGEWFSMG